MRRLALLAFLAVCALGLAGCGTKAPAMVETASSTSAAPLAPILVNKTIRPAQGLTPLGDAVPVSVAGHRTSEFTVARDPSNTTRLLAAGMDWDSPDATVQCTAFVSQDGGRSWKAVAALPGHASTREDTDPWVAVDAAGRSYLTCTEAGVGLLLGESTDGGLTWSEARPVPTGGIPAKDAIGAFGDGDLYLCFQQGKLQIMHSADRGATWQQFGFKDVIAGCNGVVQGPEGNVYVMWQGGGAIEADRPQPPPPAVGVATTKDHGASWSTTTISQDLGTAPPNMQGAPQAAAPSIAASPITGTVFVAGQRYQNAEVAGPVATGSTADTVLVRSRDAAATFAPLQLPRFPSEACADCNQVHPTLAVDDAGRLVLQVTLSTADSLHKEVWVTASADEGDSWLTPLLLATTDMDSSFASPGNFLPDPAGVAQDAQDIASDPASAPSAAQARATNLSWAVTHRDGGEYFGITTAGDTVVDLWVQHGPDGRNTITSRLVRILEPGVNP
ncbi:MAG TPA: sialidase family protein [Candidatus Thermoplasmatota archaeon]|nr:sialidase family protein [Candidatus Thermoplasmatota archaeon]